MQYFKGTTLLFMNSRFLRGYPRYHSMYHCSKNKNINLKILAIDMIVIINI